MATETLVYVAGTGVHSEAAPIGVFSSLEIARAAIGGVEVMTEVEAGRHAPGDRVWVGHGGAVIAEYLLDRVINARHIA